MERFRGIVKARQKATAIFETAKKELSTVVNRYQNEIKASELAISDHEAQIARHKEEQKFAQDEISFSLKVIEKIDTLIGV